MAKLISLSICVSDIPKEQITTANNGKKYMSITVSVNDTADQYGKDVQAWMNQSKEDREAKARKTFVGGGKVVWSSEPKQEGEPTAEKKKAGRPSNAKYEEDEILPF
jgi:hypothetical protein